jgi:hypothetical protein
MSILAKPVVGYVGAVLGVIVIASLAVFSLQGMTAKAHRHWDADIDRIIARQQAKKQGAVKLARAETPGVQSDVGPPIAALTREPLQQNEEAAASNERTSTQKLRPQAGKKSSRPPERRQQQQHYIPAAFATLPKFAATATTTTLFGLR